MKLDPIDIEKQANWHWQEIHAIAKAQKVVSEILERWPTPRHATIGLLERYKEIATDELKDFQEEYQLLILTEKSSHDRTMEEMCEDVVSEKHITEEVMDKCRTSD